MAASILHVGDDRCYRIPVMETAGLVVVRSECSVEGVRTVFAQEQVFSAVAFPIDEHPHFLEVVSTARSLTKAPLILFSDLLILADASAFDLVIPSEASPVWWLKSLGEAIADAQDVRARARQIREESEAVRATPYALRVEAVKNRRSV
jgi:hypothetical protein